MEYYSKRERSRAALQNKQIKNKTQGSFSTGRVDLFQTIVRYRMHESQSVFKIYMFFIAVSRSGELDIPLSPSPESFRKWKTWHRDVSVEILDTHQVLMLRPIVVLEADRNIEARSNRREVEPGGALSTHCAASVRLCFKILHSRFTSSSSIGWYFPFVYFPASGV